MVKLFFLNMWRFLWYGVVVFIITYLLSLLVRFIGGIALGFFAGGMVMETPPKFWYNCGIIIGGIVGLIFSAILRKSAADHDDDNCDTAKTVAVILPLLAAMLLVVAAAILSYKNMDWLFKKFFEICARLFKDKIGDVDMNVQGINVQGISDGLQFPIVGWGMYTSFPIVYFIACLIGYGRCMCTSCGHIFCIGRRLESSSSQDYTQFKTDTTRKQVGTLNVGDTKIADVYGDVKTGYYRNVTQTTKNYNCHCCVCNARSHQTETSTERGEWK